MHSYCSGNGALGWPWSLSTSSSTTAGSATAEAAPASEAPEAPSTQPAATSPSRSNSRRRRTALESRGSSAYGRLFTADELTSLRPEALPLWLCHKPVAVERDKSGGRDLVDLQCEVSVWPKEADSEHLCYTCVPPLCLPASPARGGAGAALGVLGGGWGGPSGGSSRPPTAAQTRVWRGVASASPGGASGCGGVGGTYGCVVRHYLGQKGSLGVDVWSVLDVWSALDVWVCGLLLATEFLDMYDVYSLYVFCHRGRCASGFVF